MYASPSNRKANEIKRKPNILADLYYYTQMNGGGIHVDNVEEVELPDYMLLLSWART
jgi:hypothetical protein